MSKLKFPTLLAITDNPSVRFWIKKYLEEDFFILSAAKRQAALEAAKTASLDFIIVDSEFEECNALKLCAEMKQILRTLTPILLITGRLKKTYLDTAIAAGVTDFLNNQLDPEELQIRIEAIRKGHSLREKTEGAAVAIPQKMQESSGAHLRNRFLLHNQAIQLIAEAKKEGAPVIALVMRIDRFNEIQNQIGHFISEEIFPPLSDLIVRFLIPPDLLLPSTEGRLIIVLKNKKADDARSLAERISKEVASTSFETKSGSISLTLSAAIAPLQGTEKDFKSQVDASFQALKKVQAEANCILVIEAEGSDAP